MHEEEAEPRGASGSSGDSLKVLDEVIEGDEGAHPRVVGVRLEVEGDLLGDARPAARVVVLHHLADADGQL